MKKIILTTIVFLFSFVLFATEVKEQKFNVTYSIVYNSITLKQASEIEKKLKKILAKDSCEIKIDLGIEDIIVKHNNYFPLPQSSIILN